MTTVKNPYWEHLVANVPLVDRSWRRKSYEGWELVGNGSDMISHRDTLVQKYAWAIPDQETLDFIFEHLRAAGISSVIEVGCGTGYWLWMLQQMGFSVRGFDEFPPNLGWNGYHQDRKKRGQPDGAHPTSTFVPVEPGGPEVLATVSPNRALLLCWPPYNTPFGASVLDHFRGDIVIYVGEGEWGCTGDQAMHDIFTKCFEVVAEHSNPQWDGINDYTTIYRRIRNTEA